MICDFKVQFSGILLFAFRSAIQYLLYLEQASTKFLIIRVIVLQLILCFVHCIIGTQKMENELLRDFLRSIGRK